MIETLNCENPELDKHRYNCVGIQAVVSEGLGRTWQIIYSFTHSFIHSPHTYWMSNMCQVFAHVANSQGGSEGKGGQGDT